MQVDWKQVDCAVKDVRTQLCHMALDASTRASRFWKIVREPQPKSNAETGAAKPSSQLIRVRTNLRDALKHVQQSIATLAWVFPLTVAGCSLLTSGLAFVLCMRIAALLLPGAGPELVWGLAILPSLLCGACAGHISGCLALATTTGLTGNQRRSLAMHLPARRVPAHWPGYLVNWLYGGDWLTERDEDVFMPYIRAFVTGDAPETPDDEMKLWAQLVRQAGSRKRCLEIGQATRELAVLAGLPNWVRDLSPGTTLPQLRERLGDEATRKWSYKLLRHAIERMPELGDWIDPRDADTAHFELWATQLPGDREALLVAIRPDYHRLQTKPIGSRPATNEILGDEAA